MPRAPTKTKKEIVPKGGKKESKEKIPADHSQDSDKLNKSTGPAKRTRSSNGRRSETPPISPTNSPKRKSSKKVEDKTDKINKEDESKSSGRIRK